MLPPAGAGQRRGHPYACREPNGAADCHGARRVAIHWRWLRRRTARVEDHGRADAGRRPARGLLLAFYPGFLLSLSRDLAEIRASAFLLGRPLSIRWGRPAWAALSLTAAVLTHETTAIFALAALVGTWRGASLGALLPGAVWVEDWAFLRAMSEFYVLGIVVLIGAPRLGPIVRHALPGSVALTGTVEALTRLCWP